MKELFKHLSSGFSVFLILAVMVIAFGAMLFTEEGEELFDRFTDKKSATQTMELRGDWLGMNLVGLNSATARRRNIPPSLKGVLVAEVSETRGFRAQQAGVVQGDVITDINNTRVRDINDVFEASRKINVADAVFLNVVRWGQPMTLVMPAIYQPLAMTPPGQADMAMQQAVTQQALAQQALNQQALPQQAVTVQPQPGVLNAAQGVAQIQTPNGPVWFCPRQPGALGAQGVAQLRTADGPLWVCPRHGLGWYHRYAQPNFRCPICNGQLTQVP